MAQGTPRSSKCPKVELDRAHHRAVAELRDAQELGFSVVGDPFTEAHIIKENEYGRSLITNQ